MLPSRFPIVGIFQAKSGRKTNFLRREREFSLSNLHSLVSSGLQGDVISKLMGFMEIRLFEGKFPSGFTTIGVFHAKK